MSRIELEWNIESQKIKRSDSEDPRAKRARRRNLIRLTILVACLLILIAGLGVLLRQRLQDVRAQLEQQLRDTVSAEVAALRIGDRNTFLKLQQPDNPQWLQRQETAFEIYSQMKTAGNVILTGSVLDIETDGERARATVEEYINGVPYAQVWFYEFGSDGWIHVPPDYGFWGDERTIESKQTVVRYDAVDQSFADALSGRVSTWWQQGCEILQCGGSPMLQVAVVNDSAQAYIWADEERLHLHVLSPYVDRARLDMPFDFARQQQIAYLLAERLVDLQTEDLRVVYPQDVVHLRQSLVQYLTDQFLGVDSGRTLVKSLADQYGADTIAELARRFTADSDMSLLREVIPDPLEDSRLDWRDFIKWRLDTEMELLAQRAESAWLNLYDTANVEVQAILYQRYYESQPASVLDVVDQLIWETEAGIPQLRVTAQIQVDGVVEEHIVLFNLVDDVWKRAN